MSGSESSAKCVAVCQPCHVGRHRRMDAGLPQEPEQAVAS